MISSTSFKKSAILGFLLLFVSICTAYAQQNPPTPSSSGGTSASVDTDPNTGVANVNVPPGRSGMAPNLTLSYNSNKRNGWIGVG